MLLHGPVSFHFCALLIGLVTCASGVSDLKQLDAYEDVLKAELLVANNVRAAILANGTTDVHRKFLEDLPDKIKHASGLEHIQRAKRKHAEMRPPSLVDSERNFYPVPLVLICICLAGVFAFAWETIWIKSTLMIGGKKSLDKMVSDMVEVEHEVRGQITKETLGRFFDWKVAEPEAKKDTKGDVSGGSLWSHLHTAAFWKSMEEWMKAEHNFSSKVAPAVKEAETGVSALIPLPSSASFHTADLVRFTQCSYHVLESEGCVRIGLQRIGLCAGAVTVKVETRQKSGTMQTAKAGKNFKSISEDIVFEPGDEYKTFDVEVYCNDSFDPARWFKIHITEITSGHAYLEAPSFCRVYISDDYVFPGNIPEEKRLSSFWRMYYFVLECKQARGSKFWKTMAAMLYVPIHDVIVTVLVQKFMLDWATKPHDERVRYNDIMWLAALQFFSTAILRWADVVQTKNRGRTGGIRQRYRLQLLQKLILLGYEDQWRVSGAQWFYAAVEDVDGITVDIYWQVFLTCQHLLGLILSIVCLMGLGVANVWAEGEDFNIWSMLPVLCFVLLVPVTTCGILKRTKTTAMHVFLRKKGESAWMEIFSWISHSCRFLYGFSPHELARIENQFQAEVGKFMKQHQAARDYTNDSTWISHWLTQSAYCLVLIWGGNALLASRTDGEHGQLTMSAGEFVVLLKLFMSIGQYIGLLCEGLVHFLRGEVSLGQVEKLLNTKGKDRFCEAKGHGPDVSAAKSFLSRENSKHEVTGFTEVEVITLKDIRFTPDKVQGAGPFGRIVLTSDVEFPLGSLVRVAGTDEAARLSFLGQIAGVIVPNSGVVNCPLVAERTMVLPTPITLAGRLTVLEAFELAGAQADDAKRLAHIFGLDPDQGSAHLPPGNIQLMSLGRALLRDPEVLVLARPLAYVPLPVRRRIVCLLRLWQACGGVGALLKRLRDQEESMRDGETPDLRNVETEVKVELARHRPQGHQWVPLRTLVICEEDIRDHSELCTSRDICIDLDPISSPGPPKEDTDDSQLVGKSNGNEEDDAGVAEIMLEYSDFKVLPHSEVFRALSPSRVMQDSSLSL